MKVSEERLKELAGAAGLELCDFEPVWDSLMVGEVMSMARELLALRNTRQGWKLVPVEPTEEMLMASYMYASVYSAESYRAMLAAVPEPK